MPLSGLKELLSGIAVPLTLGFISSFVRVTRFGIRSSGQFASSVLASCFVALLVHWGLDFAAFAPTVDAAIIGISSYMGGSLLDAAQSRILHDVKHGTVKQEQDDGIDRRGME